MHCYLITGDKVSALPAPLAVPRGKAILIARVTELDAKRFPLARLQAIHAALPGVRPTKRNTDRKKALKALWAALEKLPLDSAHSNSKQAQVTQLLRRPEGCDMKEMVKVTGWKAPSVRALLSATLQKRFGLTVDSAVSEGRRIYRIPA